MGRKRVEREHEEIVTLLTQMERELRELGLWDEIPPAAEDLASSVPFAHDRLEFHQWLQWVFLPRMHGLCEQAEALPKASGIAPMAEVQLAPWGAAAGRLLQLMREFDRHIENRD